MKKSKSQKKLFRFNDEQNMSTLPVNIHLVKHLDKKTDFQPIRSAPATFYKSQAINCLSFFKHVTRFSDLELPIKAKKANDCKKR